MGELTHLPRKVKSTAKQVKRRPKSFDSGMIKSYGKLDPGGVPIDQGMVIKPGKRKGKPKSILV